MLDDYCKKNMFIAMLFIVISISVASCGFAVNAHIPLYVNDYNITTQSKAPIYHLRVLQRIPQIQPTFVQGIVAHHAYLYTSSGLLWHSFLRKSSIKTGQILKQVRMPDHLFAEGLTLFKGRLYQLFWKARTGFIYSPKTLHRTGQFYYQTQGWGLTHDSHYLIMSDGSDTLRYLDPKTSRVAKKIVVHDGKHMIGQLNALQYKDHLIYANIWHSNVIAVIKSASGQVKAWIDLTALSKRHPSMDKDCMALNGVSTAAGSKQLWVTGKCWPHLYRVQLIG